MSSIFSESDSVVIVSAARTPMGAFQGGLSNLSAAKLGAIAMDAAIRQAGMSAEAIEEVLMGSVLQAGQGQAPARQAAIQAGLPLSAGCTTINKVCGSAMKALMSGHDSIRAGSTLAAMVGGMESMSNAPYLLPMARTGYRLAHSKLVDHMFFDGLEDAYSDETRGRLMGTFAEDCAMQYQFSREEQDAFAVLSTTRAKAASEDGSFDWEIAPVTVSRKNVESTVKSDEGPFAVDVAKIPRLKPAFAPNGTVTAANSSSIADGAAAMVLMKAAEAARHGLSPLARIVGHSTYAGVPAQFPTTPSHAIRKLLKQVHWDLNSVDLFEINEAFAVVAMAAIRDLNLDIKKVNVHGGACALGHPIGASGARIVVTLLGALRKYGLKRGVASLCIGGGEATALAIEML